MDINKYYCFVKTAEFKNLTAAAEYLGYTQSAASHIISALENELGFSLFFRSRNGMELTQNGKRLLPYAYTIIKTDEEVYQISDSIRGLESGNITVASFSSVTIQWLSKILSGFKSLYPGINVDVLDGSYDQIGKWISTGRVDCGFLVNTRSDTFSFKPLMDDTLYAVFPEGHPYSEKKNIFSEDLENEQFVVPSEGTMHDIQFLIGNFHPNPKPYINTIGDATALSLVKSGLGVSVLPGIHLVGIDTNDINIRRIRNCRTHTIGLAIAKGKNTPPATNQFVNYVENWIRQNYNDQQYILDNVIS